MASLLLFVTYMQLQAQDSTTHTNTAVQTTNGREWLVGGSTIAAYGGSFLFLNSAWYKGYPRSAFHFFNDAGEWQQVDKVGHAWTAYQATRLTSALWQWAGVSQNNAILLGSGTSLLYMLSIEYLDGRSAEWGWSWGDAGADIFGASLYATQAFGWKEQRVGLKFSSGPKRYPQQDLESRADNLFGRSFPERLLKDYNAQTYWLSGNIKAFFPETHLPDWLNVSVGYGAEGMFGGYVNLAKDKDGNISFDRRDIQRYRQWYLAPDVDFTKIKTRSKVLKTLFAAANMVKFPAPALELSNGRLKLKAVAY